MFEKLKEITRDPLFRSQGFTTPKELIIELIRRWLVDNDIK
tara:strand:- start:11944 stop:12066 length:123 start_codon:yes stop_codon:yes gene_type:complete